MTSERRRTARDRREAERVPAVFAVKKSVAGAVQLCQAEDIALAGITIRRPRGTSVQPRTEIRLEFALPGTGEEIAARGVVVNDALAGGFRRTGIRFIALRPEHARLIAGYCRTEPAPRARGRGA
jgi:c-di-GMP-binding flagellar brake protein YcgR